MEDIQKLVDYLQYWIALVPLHGWYIFGSLIASSTILIGIVAWIKRKHWRRDAEKLAGHLVTLNLNFLGIVLAVAGFLIANGTNLANLLPSVATHGPQIVFVATTIYALARPARDWFRERQAKKDLSPKILETIEAAASDIPQPQQKPEPVTDSLWTSGD